MDFDPLSEHFIFKEIWTFRTFYRHYGADFRDAIGAGQISEGGGTKGLSRCMHVELPVHAFGSSGTLFHACMNPC